MSFLGNVLGNVSGDVLGNVLGDVNENQALHLENEIKTIAKNICNIDQSLLAVARQHLDSLTKPQGSLGRLEEIAARIFAIQNSTQSSENKSSAITKISIDPARIYTIAGEHGVTEEGVASTPLCVNRQMVENFLKGGAGINVLCNTAGVEQIVVDAGCTGEEFANHPRLIKARIANGTKNLAKEPAMSRLECLKALSLGIDLAKQAAQAGYKAVGTGEMGIGNTTPSTALFSAFSGLDPEKFLGPGAGLNQEGLSRKLAVIKKALVLNKASIEAQEPIDILAKLSGLEIAALAGLCLGAAYYKLVLVIDGFISSAAFLAAFKIAPQILDYTFFSHLSAEPGHKHFLDALQQKPLLDLQMRLGEGSGAAVSFFLLRSACNIFNDMEKLENLNIKLK